MALHDDELHIIEFTACGRHERNRRFTRQCAEPAIGQNVTAKTGTLQNVSNLAGL